MYPGHATFPARISGAVSTLAPGYFALVMASGIISVGFELEGFSAVSGVFLAICIGAYAVLVVVNVVRIIGFRGEIVADFMNPARAFGFYTFVAGTNVLGVRLAMAEAPMATATLLVVSGSAWLILGYVIPWTAVLGRTERPVIKDANGTWFIWCVASQSVATACATLEPLAGTWKTGLALLAVLSWSVGIVLYAAVGIFVSLRLMVYRIQPQDLGPGYFVSMGAMAITVLAGARILEMADAPVTRAVHGLVAGASVVFWAFATWLLPVLIAAGCWRHLINRVPLSYESGLWSIIFPLGMYSVAGIYLGRTDQLPVVLAIGQAELWLAAAAYVATFAGMLHHLWRTLVAKL
ncbi:MULTISPECIES: tellurite resistance/C4-dicarboxylate transporter family protein [Paenarthrobacter]|uniref:tellurite resistance/C4-dicarboxylate transporter family protein n=2 Tax=Micrococcaceae TaxID=1268 RepID=UPI002230F056|nr:MULTISPECIES: tellurite resistance/C4-dicarboxylate transporter family protein [Paenarthrobacter]MCW3765793.1 tellurite resistance/C4-dicarboxylate transporter family protein [Paenarthrobacter sp. PAE-2]MCX8454969.1 tellurite resistance/C4-dicarboxylate transporter family protein [Paenarthrobacter ureafaciens]MCY0974750.1 tellurite resistance/C4-dicarboxylate transporter family protein [Paenarthrobacter ureafaciens]